jgi:hypothetical protein
VSRVVRVCGISTASVLAVLGLIHLYWTAGGQAGRAAAVPERRSRPLFQPSPASTLGVARGLFAAAALLLTHLGLMRSPVSERWTARGSWLLATLFALRAIGDFRYVGVFKRVRGTRFARWDSRLYTPLCIGIAVGSGIVAASRPTQRSRSCLCPARHTM